MLNTTGSFRTNVKNKKVCENLNFHKKLVFSAVLGQELAANLSPAASRSITITPRHPQKLAPPMCFQALVGCLRSNTDSETLSKDPRWMFHFVKAKISGVNRDEHVQTTKFVHSSLKHTVDLCSESVVVLKQATRA